MSKFFNVLGIRPCINDDCGGGAVEALFHVEDDRFKQLLDHRLFTIAECESLLNIGFDLASGMVIDELLALILRHIIDRRKEIGEPSAVASLLSYRDAKKSSIGYCSSLARCRDSSFAEMIIDRHVEFEFDLNYRYEGRPLSFFIRSQGAEQALIKQGFDMNQRADDGQTREQFLLQNPEIVRGESREEGEAYFYKHFKQNHPDYFVKCPDAVMRLCVRDEANLLWILEDLTNDADNKDDLVVSKAAINAGITAGLNVPKVVKSLCRKRRKQFGFNGAGPTFQDFIRIVPSLAHQIPLWKERERSERLLRDGYIE